MFNTLYRSSCTVARHENPPLAESRRRYLDHLAAQGAAIHTSRAAAGIIYRAMMMMKMDESSLRWNEKLSSDVLPLWRASGLHEAWNS